MSSTALAGFLLVPLALLAVALNHLLARVGIIEFALSQGLPAMTTSVTDRPAVQEFDETRAGAVLPPDSLNLFVSATCVSCARLIDDLAAPELDHPFGLDLFFSDHRSPLARRGQVHENQADVFADLAVPVTPYAVLTRDGEVLAHGPAADLDALSSLIDWKPRSEPAGRPA